MPIKIDPQFLIKYLDRSGIYIDNYFQMAEENLPQKNPAAVALGHLGGLKGGPARAKKLSSKRRKSISKKGAKARWKKKG